MIRPSAEQRAQALAAASRVAERNHPSMVLIYAKEWANWLANGDDTQSGEQP